MSPRLIIACIVAGLALLIGPNLLDRPTDPAIVATEAPDPSLSLSTVVIPELGAASTSTTTTTTTPHPHAHDEEEVEDRGTGDPVEARWPVTKSLPMDTAEWRVDYVVEGGRLVLVVTLRAVLNRPDQRPAYREKLRDYKAQVMGWLLQTTGQPASSYSIRWLPPEAATL